METTEYVYKDILDDTIANLVFNKLLVTVSEEQTCVKGSYRKRSVTGTEETSSWDISALVDGNF